MTKILLLTLVHPDFLPPVYSMAQVLADKGYQVDILTFESDAPGSFNPGKGINIHITSKHSGTASQRAAARKLFQSKANDYINQKAPTAIFSYCEFSYLTALKVHKSVPVYHFALEITDFSISKLLRSPFGALRTWKANTQLDKAAFVSTPSYERSGWLAGRYNLKRIPETVQNTPFIPSSFEFPKGASTLIPERFKNKIKILNTGGVNHTRSVIELIKGFETSESNTSLIITNVSNAGYSQEVRKIVEQSPRKDDILILGTISRSELIELQASCQIGICLMKLENGFDARMIAPNKVGEYLASGLLVLGMNTPYFHQFIAYDVAELIDDLSQESIGEALNKLVSKTMADNYQKTIMACLNKQYNMEKQLEQVLTLIAKH